MNQEWITGRVPFLTESFAGKVWVMRYGFVHFGDMLEITKSDVWLPIKPPEKYIEPKHYKVIDSNRMGYESYEIWDENNKRVAKRIFNYEAAERIAAIYEEIKP